MLFLRFGGFVFFLRDSSVSWAKKFCQFVPSLSLVRVIIGVEMAFRFCDESVVVDLPHFVAADQRSDE